MVAFARCWSTLTFLFIGAGALRKASQRVTNLPKILALHGGGQSASAFRSQSSALASALSSNYEFVYAQSPEAGSVWMRDAPGGKGSGTTDPAWAQTSMDYLDDFIASNGPFEGIMGYSQGSAFATYYVSQRQTAQYTPFNFTVLFCGYLPTVHRGLTSAIETASPFNDIPALVFMGERDFIISNGMTNQQAGEYTNPTVLSSPSTGHDLPASGSSEFNTVVAWMGGEVAPSPAPVPTPPPSGPCDSWCTPSYCVWTGYCDGCPFC